MPRFMVCPLTGRPRVIDDGRRGEHNEFLYADGTIDSISPDWALEASTIMLEEWLWCNKGIPMGKLTPEDVPGLVPE